MAGGLVAAVEAALTDRSAPAAELALTYALSIDLDPDQLGDLGPKLLACLDALLLTPKSLKAVRNDQPAASPLDELRARRAARQRHAEAVDPTAS